jgi:hypothetical protein
MKIVLTQRFLDDITELETPVRKKCRQLITEIHKTDSKQLITGGLPGWRLHKL